MTLAILLLNCSLNFLATSAASTGIGVVCCSGGSGDGSSDGDCSTTGANGIIGTGVVGTGMDGTWKVGTGMFGMGIFRTGVIVSSCCGESDESESVFIRSNICERGEMSETECRAAVPN